ncbi:zinc finger protein 391 isoform X2 [Anabrus simplex]|uniref:zinc finger protein 391 isoform X2 n=1 Tax=Anabrus simplex TaxID=316456 RepID=UPI0035A2D3BA
MEDPQIIKCEPESTKEEQPHTSDLEIKAEPRQLVEVKKEPEVKQEILSEEANASKPLSNTVIISSLTAPGNIPVAGSILNCVAPFKITKKDGSHSCSTCGQSFTRLEHLRRHTLSHVGEKPISCTTCGKTFSRLDHMKIHELVHLGERPHVCTTCGMTFAEITELKTHSLVHLQGKKYSCNQCGGYFKHESSLKKHQAVHFGNAPNTCGKTYTEKHQNKKEPHVCRTCGQMFMRLSHFTRHRLLHKSDGRRLDL